MPKNKKDLPAGRHGPPAGRHGIFLKESLSDIRSIGTICSTSKFVAKAMVSKIEAGEPAKVIIELGMGTGSITKEIIKHLRPQDIFVGIEQNANLLEVCRENICVTDKHSNVKLEHDFAQNIDAILKKYKIAAIDNIICTIPFRILPKNDTEKILGEIKKNLKPGGIFSFIRLMPAPETKLVYEALDNFSIVSKKLIMRNIPPAEVITMKKNQ